ncbi:hypothetical protein RRG08_020929 [Elysia crispata]|uniref:Uncharacterized protein n=1 Tax=Elysia crispata TaxID=231223 RepID=A0AAE1DUV2_9GAST|nr:hypothetical protein RRG08_020929 [Elysia crispata]
MEEKGRQETMKQKHTRDRDTGQSRESYKSIINVAIHGKPHVVAGVEWQLHASNEDLSPNSFNTDYRLVKSAKSSTQDHDHLNDHESVQPGSPSTKDLGYLQLFTYTAADDL